MGIQDSIANSLSGLRRSVFDYKIKTSGFDGDVIKVTTSRDMYGDLNTINVESSDKIPMVLDLPNEIPIQRLRKTVTEAIPSETQNLYLFEIIPITGYARFQDKIHKEDYLIIQITDQDPSIDEDSDPYLFILKVTEIIAAVDIRNITHTKFQCAPYNEALPSTVQDEINLYQYYD